MGPRLPVLTVPMSAAAALLLSLSAIARFSPVVGAETTNPHAAHQHEPAAGENSEDGSPAVSRSVLNYVVPPIPLLRDDGQRVKLSDELSDERPVVLNFVYTTCPGICPLASHVFSELQRSLGPERDRVHLMSISIDPEEDTPARLRAYA